ncbi:MAG: ABC transporter permease [Gemmatimonadaceae bacterium]
MPPLGRFARPLRRLWKIPVAREVDAELAFHLEMRTREYIAGGMDPAAARAEATRRFGDVAEINATCQDLGRRRDDEMRRAQWISELGQDVRYALRQLRANPGFAAVAVLTLALGIGASTTIFGVANAVLLRPLPFGEPARLVRLFGVTATTDQFSASEPDYLDWRAQNRTFADMGAFMMRNVSLVGGGEPEQLPALGVTPSFFRVLGVRPLAGRVFAEEEGRPGGGDGVVVLSHGFWLRRFGGNHRALGQTLSLSGASYEVVGVMPPGFESVWGADVWLPLAPAPTSVRADHGLGVIGRLRPGATAARAASDMRDVAAQLTAQYPESNKDYSVRVVTFADWLIGAELRARVIVLLVAVGLLLLMACANVANLLLARAGARSREISLRAALGAGRGRIVRQLLTESVVLSLVGAAFGVAFAVAAVPVLREAGADSVARINELTVDWRVLTFGIAASLLTGLLFGLAPVGALMTGSGGGGLHGRLRSGARIVGAGRLRAALIVASVAMAVLLLVGAGLVGGSWMKLTRVDPGFRAGGVLTAQLTLPRVRYPEVERQEAFYTEALRRIAAVPGVRSAGATNIAPFSGGDTGIPFTVVGRAPTGEGEALEASWRSVTPGYFAALGVPLRRGRVIAEADGRRAPKVVVISETMARRVWPGVDPVGQAIRVPRDTTPWMVVGVVGDIRDQALQDEPVALMYLSFAQVTWPSMWLVVRTAGEPGAAAGAVRREIWSLDPTLPVAEVQPLSRLVSAAAAEPRFTMLIFALFAAAALALAVVGVYGIVAYGVTQRRREIGGRLALGARPRQIVSDTLRHGVGLAALGAVLGLGVAYALSRFLATILYGVAPTNAATYVGVAVVIVSCAALASLAPARRASRLDPVQALRSE